MQYREQCEVTEKVRQNAVRALRAYAGECRNSADGAPMYEQANVWQKRARDADEMAQTLTQKH